MSFARLVSRVLFFGAILSVVIISAICIVNAVQWVDKPFAGFLLNERMVIGNVGRYHWTGTQAALKYPDKIVKANDTPLFSMQDLEQVIHSLPVGQPVTYAVERAGQIRDVTVPTMDFTWADLFVAFGITLFIGLAYLFLGSLVFVLKPDTMISWTFFLVCFFLSVYTIVSFDTQSTHWGFIRVYIAVLTFFPAALIHLSVIFPEKKNIVEKYPSLPVVLYLGSLILVMPFQVLYPDPSFMHIYQLILAYLVMSAIIFVASTLRAGFGTSSIIAKQRARVILLGAGLAFPLPLLAQYMSLFGGETFIALPIQINFAAIPVVIFPASIAYAMVKHNLFDIDTIVRRTCGYVLSTAAIVCAYIVIVSVLNLTARTSEVARSPFFSLGFTLAMIFLFEPLHRRLQNVVDRVFYRQHYDYRKTIKDVSETMISILDPDLIHRTLIGSVVKEMFLENGLFLLPDPARHVYHIQVAEGVEPGALTAQQLAEGAPLVQVLQEKNDALFRYEVEINPHYRPQRAALQQAFESFSSEVMLPMRYKDDLLGIISLGQKKSGKMFTLEDLDLLKTMTNQSAMALENARLFQEHLEKTRLDEELKIAHNIQVSMLPEKAPALAGVQIAARSLPARQVGGDFYDFIEVGGNGTGPRLGIVVGDVSGKAVSAALLMAASRSTFRVLAESHASVEDIMMRGNQRLIRDIKKGTFVALLYAVVDPEHKTLTLANAGQTQPILCPAARSSQPVYIDTDGDKFPLGIVKQCQYQETCLTLNSRDAVVFYTDGIVEALNEHEEMYGFERLMAVIAQGRDLSAPLLLDSLLNDVSRFVGNAEQHDDLTVVVLKTD